ncbi:ATP-binding protein [Chloroflexales bacterium ZM16-3]|nr:ATP-binding protein [Chloroflexales bacterium ZM16-3]
MNTPTNAYASLSGWLGWLRRLLSWQIEQTRFIYGALADDPQRGLYIPDIEADLLAAGPFALPEDLRRQRTALVAERAELERSDTDSSLARLCQRFGLDPFGHDVILLTLAPAIDLGFERLYAYIQDDVTRRRPMVDLALRLFCLEPTAQVAARASFAVDAPLRRHRLIQLLDEGQASPNLIAYGVKLAPRIVAALLGQPAIDDLISPFAQMISPTRSLKDLVLPTMLIDQARRIFAAPGPGPVIALDGAYGSGRQALAEALCAEPGQPMLLINGPQLRASDLPAAEAISRCLREARLSDAVLFWQGADTLLDSEAALAWREALLAGLDQHPGCAFLALSQPSPGRMLRHSTQRALSIPMPNFTERAQIWRQSLGDLYPMSDEDLAALGGTFRISGGQIRDAVQAARDHASQEGRALTKADFYAACRGLSAASISKIAWKIPLTYHWDDLVLPADQVERLREVCIQVRYRRIVLEDWGFEAHLAMGKGVNLLFAGESGTGKTMAAEVIAVELGLDLYKIDLSGMVSKYIGETEKNLDRVFIAAREANAILFFDEADAIFGKRSEVKDAHDRYANIEVAYLLQRIEAYDGLVILATNLRNIIDPAFLRRMHMVVDFPAPKEPERLRIWHKVFPDQAPLDTDVNLKVLAQKYELTGGNIRNVALLAAYLAAESGTSITMAVINRALRREYQKLGRMSMP